MALGHHYGSLIPEAAREWLGTQNNLEQLPDCSDLCYLVNRTLWVVMKVKDHWMEHSTFF